MPSTTVSIIISAASAVGKTFLIGATGYYAVKRPVGNPYLPKTSINMLSRFSFHILLLPLIYTGVASSVTLESLSSLWFIVLASMVIIAISYIVATILAYLPCFRVYDEEHFDALRVAIAFPNIVALPIIIFPALCEFEVFHEFGEMVNKNTMLKENMATCEAEANAVVFTYFFGFSILFWSFGNHALRKLHNSQGGNHTNNIRNSAGMRQSDNCCNSIFSLCKRMLFLSYAVIKDILMSPGFIVLLLSFATACVKPLQDALFVPGGTLRVIGSALESLTSAGATIATIVVAAALADDTADSVGSLVAEEATAVAEEATNHSPTEICHKDEEENQKSISINTDHHDHEQESGLILQKQEAEASKERRSRNTKSLRKIVDHPTFKVQVWHVVSRLFVTPAVIFGALLKLDCIVDISPIAKLVLLINSSLPGALIVIVILKAGGCAKAASIVSQTYLPSYTLSVITIAAWATVGMMAFNSDSSAC